MLLIVLCSNKEGLLDYKAPIDQSSGIFTSMLNYDTSANVTTDLQYFNNTSNLLYGFQRMPTL